MRTNLATITRSLAFAVASIAFLTLSQSVVRAEEVTLSGSTTGTVTGVPQLTFVGNSFTGTTALGIGSLSGINSLGTLFLNPGDTQLLSGQFVLNVTLTSPAGIIGGQSSVWIATIVGSVSPNVDQGGVSIHFLDPTQVGTFNDGTHTGSFSITLADLFVQTGRSANLTAGFTGSQDTTVPEPATLILLGTGLAGVASRLRKRRRSAGKSSE